MECTHTCMTDSIHISPYLIWWIIVTSSPINDHALSVMYWSFFWCQQGTTCWCCLQNDRNHLCMCVRFHAPVQVYMCMHWFQCLEHKAFCQKKLVKRKKKTALLRIKHDFIIFHTLLSTLMWTPVSNFPLKRPINSMEKEESIYKISKGDVQKVLKLMQ